MSEIPDDFARRIGRFTISKFLVDTDPKTVITALSGAIVVRCEYMYHTADLEYLACHSTFDPVSPGHAPPTYQCVFTMHEDGSVTHEWRKVP